MMPRSPGWERGRQRKRQRRGPLGQCPQGNGPQDQVPSPGQIEGNEGELSAENKDLSLNFPPLPPPTSLPHEVQQQSQDREENEDLSLNLENLYLNPVQVRLL